MSQESVYSNKGTQLNTNYNFAVIFDMDGVIVDSNPYHKIALQQFCRQHDHHLSDEQMKLWVFGRTNNDWLRAMFGEISDADIKKYETEKEELFRRIIEPHIRPIPGLIDFLELLTANHITLAIATSAPAVNVDFTLTKTGTNRYFPTIITGDDVALSKPNPEIYLKTIRQINFPPQDCVVIEDSLSGIEAARRAGCRVVGITTTHSFEELTEADLVIDDFHSIDLLKLSALFNPSG